MELPQGRGIQIMVSISSIMPIGGQTGINQSTVSTSKEYYVMKIFSSVTENFPSYTHLGCTIIHVLPIEK